MRVVRFIALLLAVVVAATMVAFFVAPASVIGFVAGRAAAWNDIDVQGLDTLTISLSEGTISAGPVSFRHASAKLGKIGRFEADLNLPQLFAGRILLRDVHLADVDLALTVETDGSYALNGIRLRPADEGEEIDEQKRQQKETVSLLPRFSVEHAHVEALRVDITRAPDLSLPLSIDRLRIIDLSGEAPNRPAKFEITGEAGEVRFDYNGTIKAFDDPLEIALNGRFDGLTMAGIEIFTGPLGLARREGLFSAKARHKLALTQEGKVTVTTVGSLTTNAIALAWPDSIDVRLDRSVLKLDTKATVLPDGQRELSNRGAFEVGELSISWPDSGSIKVKTATANIDIDARIAADQHTRAALKGSVPLQDLVVAWSKQGGVQIADGTAQLDLNIGLAPDGKMTIVGPMAVKGGSGGIHSGESFKLSYQGIDADYPDASVDLAPDGTATVAGTPRATLTGFLLEAPVAVGAATATATSEKVHVVSPPQGAVVEYGGSLDLKDAYLGIGDESKVLMTSADFSLSEFHYDEDASLAAALRSNIGARALGIRLEAKKPIELPVSDAAVNLAGLDLHLTPEGGIRRVAVDPATQITLEGTAGGQPNRVTLGLQRLEITDLDPAVPDQMTHADILAVINGSGQIELTEHVKPFARPPEFVFNGAVKNLALPELSPYFAAAFGLDADSGRFNATGHATAQDGKLDGVVNLKIHSLELEPASEDSGDLAADLTGVPVTLAVALLEDSKRRIRVSLPFSGDLSSPRVDYCDVIRTALLGALRVVVTAPLAGIASAAGRDDASRFALRPALFAPGSASLSEEAKRHLDHVADLLAEKGRLRFKVCGLATGEDAAALGAPLKRNQPSLDSLNRPGAIANAPETVSGALSSKLLALAQSRTRAAIAYLQRAPGVRARQVQECRPTANVDDTGPPRVETRL